MKFRFHLAGRCCLGVILLFALPVRAETPTNNAMTGLDKGHAPPWLKPGVRLTYRQAASLIPGGFDELVRDEKGRIVNRNSGQRYDEVGQQGLTAYTFVKLDVAAVRDNAVVLDDHAYTLDINGQHFLPPTATGEIVAPGHGGDTWIDPQVLQNQPNANTDAVMVYRMDYPLAGKTYHGIAFSVRSPTSWNYSIFDLETGLLLHQASATQGAGHLERNGTNIEQGKNDTILSQSTFVSLRQLQIPWAGAHLPRSADTDRFTYQGAHTVSMSGVTTTIPMVVEMTAHDRAPDIVPLKLSIAEYALGPNAAPLTSSAERVAAPDEVLPLFMDTAELAKLQQGQEIDRDPDTHYVIAVTFVGRSPHGRDVVSITESNGADNPSTQYIYDKATGAMIAYELDVPATHQRVAVVLK